MKRIASVLALPENTEQSLSLWRVIVEGDKTKDNEAANLFDCETVRSPHALRIHSQSDKVIIMSSY